MEKIDVLHWSLAALGAEIWRFVMDATDLEEPVELITSLINLELIL